MKGNQWHSGMKAHIGVDAGYVHSVTAIAASVHDLDQITHLVRPLERIAAPEPAWTAPGIPCSPNAISNISAARPSTSRSSTREPTTLREKMSMAQ